MKVRDLMSSPAVTVSIKDTARHALQVMRDNDINGTPVLDENGELHGMVVKADIYRFLIEPGHIEDCPIDWVMSKDVMSIDLDQPIEMANRKIREKKVVSIPVMEEGKLVGVISFEDLLDYYLDRDEGE